MLNGLGAGIYVVSSGQISNSSVPNNTALRVLSSSGRSQFSFYCLSNSTSDEFIPSILYQYGRIYPNRTENNVEVSQSLFGLYVSGNSYSFSQLRGIYTCDIADSNGEVIQLSIGAYHSIGKLNHLVKTVLIELSIFLGTPSLYSRTYTSHIEDAATDVLITVNCLTQSYPPSTIVWSRNGVEIPVDDRKYIAYQTVTNNRYYSYYQNSLVVQDVVGIVNRPIYTCDVKNAAGSQRGTVHIPTISVTLSLAGYFA